MSAADHGELLREREHPDVLAANLRVGSRLFSAAVAFMFMAFVFAFLYLRAVNSYGAFKPAHTDPRRWYGIAILACVVVAALVFDLVRRRLADGTELSWRAGATLVIGLVAAAIGLQCLQFSRLSFGPTDGGYASVFVGWSGLFAVTLLGALYWVETLWAQSLRESVPSEAHESPAALLRPSADACVVFLYLLAGVEVFTFVLLYLVK